MEQVTGIAGVFVLLGIAWVLSVNRRGVRLRPVVWGLILQFVLALLLLKWEWGMKRFDDFSGGVARFLGFAVDGAKLLFNVPRDQPLVLPVVSGEQTVGTLNVAVLLIVQLFATIIFFSAFMSVLYHLGIVQVVISAMARVMRRSMGVSGAESLAAAANVFVGQTEAPLVIRPYIPELTQSELMAVMVAGFSTIAGSVMGIYIHSFGVEASHVLAASIMSAPAAFAVAKILIPETATPKTAGVVRVSFTRDTVNVVDAAASGATTGMRLALNVVAMLIAFLAILAVIDSVLGAAGRLIGTEALRAIGVEELNLRTILGLLFAPLAYVLGVPWGESLAVGKLLGTKVAVNEFVAYSDLAGVRDALSDRAVVIASFALCGFANFGSIAIQLGGIGGLVPERRKELARLGVRAMIGGALASWLTAAIAGILIRP